MAGSGGLSMVPRCSCWNPTTGVVATAAQPGSEIEARVRGAVEELHGEAQRRITDAVSRIPQIAIRTPEQNQQIPTGESDLPSARADAKDRATRTLLQGGIAAVLVAVFTTLAQALGTGALDPTSWESWRVVGGTVLGAAIMAGVSFVQRLVQPPKGQ
ncbi:MAG: hypothetical protein GX610_05825 [Rhodococcus sp.]|nr:hypothetical protein [Rhodococcus sp. (in: high G+C Gram-positive bacteria)]